MEYIISPYDGKRRSASYIVCEECGKEFLRDNRDIKKNKHHFCNKECESNHKSVICTCAQCGVEFKRKKSSVPKSKSGLLFCCRECKDKSLRVGGDYPEFLPEHYGTSERYNPTRKCLNCEKLLCNSDTKYCSKKCQHIFQYKQYIEQWKQGLVSGNSSNEESLSVHIRKYMFEKYNSKCQKCGWSKIHSTTNKVPLSVNHIDGNHKNSTEDNLELLCPNCHALTHNYGSLNRGNGRKNRLAKLRDWKISTKMSEII